ncbi:hypothetical protein [Bartonella sp. AP33XZML]|uniref:hypothetical protein n=1 Tax=Bartonella sp. AP33XZML TaxID=3243491 RepID=UPI0035CFFCCC
MLSSRGAPLGRGLADMEKGGMKKRALYMGNCRRLCGGKLPAGSLGDKAMKGQVVIQ